MVQRTQKCCSLASFQNCARGSRLGWVLPPCSCGYYRTGCGSTLSASYPLKVWHCRRSDTNLWAAPGRAIIKNACLDGANTKSWLNGARQFCEFLGRHFPLAILRTAVEILMQQQLITFKIQGHYCAPAGRYGLPVALRISIGLEEKKCAR